MKSLTISALAGAALAQETVNIFGGLPSIQVAEPDMEAINEWAEGVDEAGRAIDAKVESAFETYQAAVKAPVEQFLAELDAANEEYDKLAAKSLADMLRYAGDNTFIDDDASLAEVFPAINAAVEELNSFSLAAPQPVVLLPAEKFNYYWDEYMLFDPCSSEINLCEFDYDCFYGNSDSSDYEIDWYNDCVDQEYTDYVDRTFYNWRTQRYEYIDPRDPRYWPCEFDYECWSNGDKPAKWLPKAKRDWHYLQVLAEFVREKAEPYLEIKRAYDERVYAQVQADLDEARNAAINEIQRNLDIASSLLDEAKTAESEFMDEAADVLSSHVMLLAEGSQQELDLAHQRVMQRNEVTAARFNALAARLERIPAPLPEPVVMQTDTVAADDATEVRENLQDTLAEKAAVYEQLDQQFREELQAQFASDLAEVQQQVQQQVATSLDALAGAIEQAADQLSGEDQEEAAATTVSLAKKKSAKTTEQGSGYSAVVYGAVGVAAVLGIAAAGVYASSAKKQSGQKGTEPLLA